MFRQLVASVFVCLACLLRAEPAPDAKAMEISQEELRHSIGRWDVVTDLLQEDGSVMTTTHGTYEFHWIVPDHIAAGKSETQEMNLASGILFYIKEKEGEIEMASVGTGGKLWIMTGPLGGNVRMTPEDKNERGGMSRLRFTRYNVLPNSFESKMEITRDGGKTWKPGNHQRFVRLEGEGVKN